MRKLLQTLTVCLVLAGCERVPPDPVLGSAVVLLELTEVKLSKHTHFSFRDVATGYRYNRVGTGKYCSQGKRWRVGDRVRLTVFTYQGKKGQYNELPRSEAIRLCR